MRVLTWLDWFNVTTLIPITDPEARRIAPALPQDDLLEAIHCVTPDGAVHRGARCIRFLGMRLPLLIPVSVLLWIPGVIYIAEWIYMRISRNRYWLSRWFGCKEACSIMPAKRRDKDKGIDRVG